MTDNKITNRESNIELLRIVLMFMVLLIHLITHSCGLFDANNTLSFTKSATVFQLFIFSFIVVAVNSFVFISGFYGIKFKLKGLLSFVIQAIFYSVVIYIIFEYDNIKLTALIRHFFPITTSVWWFLTIFIGLYIISPLLNAGIDTLKKNQLEIVVTGMVFFNLSSFFLTVAGKGSLGGSGYSLFNFMTLYILGGYLRKYKIIPKYSFLWYVLLCLAYFAISLFYLETGKLSLLEAMFSYTNPIIFFAAVFLFFTFKNLKIEYKPFINATSILVFAVYLIHDIGYVRLFLVDCVKTLRGHTETEVSFFIYFFVLALFIFIICLFIEKIRQIICAPLIRFISSTKLFQKIEKKDI